MVAALTEQALDASDRLMPVGKEFRTRNADCLGAGGVEQEHRESRAQEPVHRPAPTDPLISAMASRFRPFWMALLELGRKWQDFRFLARV